MRRFTLALLLLLSGLACAQQAVTGPQQTTPPYTITVGAATPVFSYSPIPVAFPSTVLGANASILVVVTNQGGLPLILSSFVSNNAQFTGPGLPTDTCSGKTLATGITCSILAIFTPTAVGVQPPGGPALFTVNDNTSVGTNNISLSGTGLAVPVSGISCSPSSLAFGNVNLGSNVTQTLTCTNTGTANLTIGTITSSGTIASSVTGPGLSTDLCSGKTVLPAANCTIVLKFAPTIAGAQTGTLAIPNNSATTPYNVAMSGTGMGVAPPAPAISCAPSPAAFGSVTTSTSANKTETCTNTGTATLTIGTITVSPVGPFTVSSNTCISVLPAAPCTFVLTFSPTVTGSQTATVNIPNNSTVTPYTIPATGTGASPITYDLTVTYTTGINTVTSSPSGIACPGGCDTNYVSGTVVTLTESPAAGYTFTAWGGACSGSATTATVTMTAAKSCSATFAPIPVPSITNPTCGIPPCALTPGTSGTAYTYTFAATGGTAPYTWSVSSGSFSACGVTLTGSTGVLAGTAAVGTCSATIKVTDSYSPPQTATLAVTLAISSVPLTGVPASMFAADWNKSSSSWCPKDGAGAPAQIYWMRIWASTGFTGGNGSEWAQIYGDATETSPNWVTLDGYLLNRAAATTSANGGTTPPCPGQVP